MKTLFLLFLLGVVVAIIGSCSEGLTPNGGEVLPKIDTFNCPAPLDGPNGFLNVPKHGHHLQRRSPDGTKIAYVVNENIIKIITLKSGIVETYIPKNMMPPNVFFNGCFDLHWCPYDDNKLCFMFVTTVDTTGTGKIGVYGQNLFILYRKENRFDMVDLPFMPKVGSETLHIYGWLTGSTNLTDSFFIGYARGSVLVTGITIMPEKKTIPVPDYDGLRLVGGLIDYLYSPDGEHSAAFVQQLRVPPYGNTVFIDGIPLKFVDKIVSFKRLCWSPDGKQLAITLLPNYGYQTVWIMDIEKWLQERPAVVPVQTIDFPKRFCMYDMSSFGTIDAEFITNTTLAVSANHDGDVLCPLWEITTDGRLLRQITHDD